MALHRKEKTVGGIEILGKVVRLRPALKDKRNRDTSDRDIEWWLGWVEL